eukprot:g10375.t1
MQGAYEYAKLRVSCLAQQHGANLSASAARANACYEPCESRGDDTAPTLGVSGLGDRGRARCTFTSRRTRQL